MRWCWLTVVSLFLLAGLQASAQTLGDCGDCEGKVTQLTLQYNGPAPATVRVIQKSGATVFNQVVAPAAQFTIVGTDRGTLGPWINFQINGTQHTRIHTSCSQPIGPGLISGDFTVIDGYSLYGGRLCSMPCAPCVGGVTLMTLRYDGTSGATVRVLQDNGTAVFNASLQPGQLFTLIGQRADNTFGNQIDISINGAANTSIDTSCANPIGAGLTSGSFTVIEAWSRDNGKTCEIKPFNHPPTALPDNASLPEDSSLALNVLNNDSDPDGDALTVIGVTQGAHGAVTINPDGTVRYTPNPDFNGNDSFSYIVSDGNGGTAHATVAITVLPLNDKPIAFPDTATVPEGASVNISVLDNDSDIDGDLLTVISVTQGAHGSVTINPEGTVRYTPNPDFNGNDAFDYTASDGHGGTASAQVLVSVTPVPPPPSPDNKFPEASGDVAAVDEDSMIDVDVLANDTDPDGDTLTVIMVTQGAHGSVAINPDGTVRYTPNPNFWGNDFFDYTISDGHGGIAASQVLIVVKAVNDSPIASSDTGVVNKNSMVDIDVLDNDTDADGDALTVISVTQGGNGSVSINADGTVRYTPNPEFNGVDSFSYTVSDGNGGSASSQVVVTVNPGNNPPTVLPDAATGLEDGSVNIDVLDNDSDTDGDPLTIISVTQGGNGSVTINPDNTVTYTPLPNFNGIDSFSYTASDGNGGTASASVTLTLIPVNDNPTLVTETAVVPEDQSVTINVLDNDSDVDGDTLTLIGVTQGGNGTVQINPDNTVTYTPNPNFNGNDSFTYTASDGNGGTASVTVTITVTPVNDPPSASGDTATVEEDSTVDIDVIANDSDLDGDPLTVIEVTQGANGTVAINPDGTIRYTPSPDFNGSDSFAYTIHDGNGGVASAGVAVTVTPLNDPPTAVEDTASTMLNTAVNVNVLANDFDLDGDSIFLTGVTQGSNGSVAINPDGTVRYTPNPAFAGNDTFSYTIRDANNAAGSAQVHVKVDSNNSPVAMPDTATTPEDTPLDINVLANDSDPDGDPLTIASAGNGNAGVVTINPDGTVRYQPNPNFTGTDTFSYSVSDQKGGAASAAVTVTLTPVNDDPTANADSGATTQNTAIDLNVLANDSDVDGDAFTLTQVTPGANGAVMINPDGTVRYTPNTDFVGNDTFTYTIDDGNGGAASAVVSISVVPPGSPIAMPDLVRALENTTICVTDNILLSNDTGSGLALTSVPAATLNGGTIGFTDGVISYTPPAFFLGLDSFTYVATDGQGRTAEATVTLQVDPPVIDILDALHLNRQTANFEQTVRLRNPVLSSDCGTMGAVRILIIDLPDDAMVANASGFTNGIPYIQYDQSLAPGESVTFVVEYHLLDRVNLPSPVYLPQVVNPAPELGPVGTLVPISQVIPLQDGRILLEFMTIPGRTYAIQYSSNLLLWKTAQPLIVATSQLHYWIDDGPPKTDQKPSEVSMRCYQLLLLPPQ